MIFAAFKWAFVVFVLFCIVVRFIPVSVPSQKSGPNALGTHIRLNGVKRVGPHVQNPQYILAELDSLILSTPRTHKIAQGVYVTRSFVLGTPDITQVWVDDAGFLHIHARFAYLGHDWGVNKRRIDKWWSEVFGG